MYVIQFGPFTASVLILHSAAIIMIVQINLDITKVKTTLHSRSTRDEADKKELEGQALADKEHSNRIDSITDVHRERENSWHFFPKHDNARIA